MSNKSATKNKKFNSIIGLLQLEEEGFLIKNREYIITKTFLHNFSSLKEEEMIYINKKKQGEDEINFVFIFKNVKNITKINKYCFSDCFYSIEEKTS